MTPNQEVDALESTVAILRSRLLENSSRLEDKHQHLQSVLVENKELEAKRGKVNIFYALAMLVMVVLLLTVVADDLRLRFVVAEYTLMTEELIVEVERYAQVKEAQTADLEGMVFGGMDTMNECADTLNSCGDMADELGVALRESLGREAEWKSIAQECLGLSD